MRKKIRSRPRRFRVRAAPANWVLWPRRADFEFLAFQVFAERIGLFLQSVYCENLVVWGMVLKLWLRKLLQNYILGHYRNPRWFEKPPPKKSDSFRSYAFFVYFVHILCIMRMHFCMYRTHFVYVAYVFCVSRVHFCVYLRMHACTLRVFSCIPTHACVYNTCILCIATHACVYHRCILVYIYACMRV